MTVKEPIPQTATIEVHAAEVGKRQIPRTIFGTFLEPIGIPRTTAYGRIVAESQSRVGLWSPEKLRLC